MVEEHATRMDIMCESITVGVDTNHFFKGVSGPFTTRNGKTSHRMSQETGRAEEDDSFLGSGQSKFPLVVSFLMKTSVVVLSLGDMIFVGDDGHD